MVLDFMANMAASPQAFETEYYWTFWLAEAAQVAGSLEPSTAAE